jgi:hypothetical protein
MDFDEVLDLLLCGCELYEHEQHAMDAIKRKVEKFLNIKEKFRAAIYQNHANSKTV